MSENFVDATTRQSEIKGILWSFPNVVGCLCLLPNCPTNDSRVSPLKKGRVKWQKFVLKINFLLCSFSIVFSTEKISIEGKIFIFLTLQGVGKTLLTFYIKKKDLTSYSTVKLVHLLRFSPQFDHQTKKSIYSAPVRLIDGLTPDLSISVLNRLIWKSFD